MPMIIKVEIWGTCAARKPPVPPDDAPSIAVFTEAQGVNRNQCEGGFALIG